MDKPASTARACARGGVARHSYPILSRTVFQDAPFEDLQVMRRNREIAVKEYRALGIPGGDGADCTPYIMSQRVIKVLYFRSMLKCDILGTIR